jgi:hypothetical protein
MTFVLARLGVNQRALHHPATAQQKPRRSWGRRRGCMVEAGEASVGHGALYARPRLRVVNSRTRLRFRKRLWITPSPSSAG